MSIIYDALKKVEEKQKLKQKSIFKKELKEVITEAQQVVAKTPLSGFSQSIESASRKSISSWFDDHMVVLSIGILGLFLFVITLLIIPSGPDKKTVTNPVPAVSDYLPYRLDKTISQPEVTITTGNEPIEVSYNLQGILFDNDQPIALNNDRQLRAGDSIAGATIIRISDSGVTLQVADNTIHLPLN